MLHRLGVIFNVYPLRGTNPKRKIPKMTTDYIQKYNLPTPAELMAKIDHNKYMATFRPNCLSNARAINERAGRFFFSPDTSRFFNARYGYFFESGVFTHSVRDKYSNAPREYRVAWISPNGEVFDLTTFRTSATAERCARFYHNALVNAGILNKYYR